MNKVDRLAHLPHPTLSPTGGLRTIYEAGRREFVDMTPAWKTACLPTSQGAHRICTWSSLPAVFDPVG